MLLRNRLAYPTHPTLLITYMNGPKADNDNL